MNYLPVRTKADALTELLSPGCDRLAVVGALRRGAPVVKEICFLAIPKIEQQRDGSDMFGGSVSVNLLDGILRELQTAGRSCVAGDQFVLGDCGIPVRVIQTDQLAWAAMLFQHTGSFHWGIVAATVAKAKGLKWWPEAGGFVDRKTNALVHPFEEEVQVLEAIHGRWVRPEDRNWEPEFTLLASNMPLPMSPLAMREWSEAQHWVDTTCGGDPHQYTLRILSPAEHEFVRIVEMIEAFGYDGIHKRRKYRYLDLDGFQYFTMGESLSGVALINRKRIHDRERAWVENPVPWVHWPQRKASTNL